ncbi:MAG: hypothetical protein WD358_05320 [Nitriliruptoraceae bacterium]
MADKRRRQHLLRQLVEERPLTSQSEVVAALAEHGVAVHEATVSRDLAEMGAIKTRGGDGVSRYRFATETPTATGRERLDDTLHQFVTKVTASGNLAILRTPPACAHPVASVLDLADLDDVAATVAGDDTVLVVAREGLSGRTLADDLARRAGVTVR